MHERISINSNCFPGADLEKLGEILRELAPRRISLVSLSIGDDPAPLRALIEGGGYGFESIVHPFLLGEALDGGDAVLGAAQARLSRLIDMVGPLGCRSIYVGTGSVGALTWEAAANRFSRAVAPCLAQARAAGVALMVENTPPLYAEMSMATSLRDAVTLAETAHLGVCIDFFGCWSEAGLRETIIRAMPRCGLVQVSDHAPGERSLPGRAVPGDGNIPLRRMLEWVLEAGYGGAFDLELTGPRITGEGVPAVRRAADWLGETLRELGV